MRRYARTCALVLLSAAIVAAADAPYFGKWKLNSNKTELDSITSIEKLPSGEYHYDQDGFAYNFKLDGHEYPAPDGGTSAWKMVDDKTWEVTTRANGKVSGNFKLSVSGDTLTADISLPQADGKTITAVATSKRISGGPGFVGKWRSSKLQGDDTWLDLAPDGPDGLKVASPNSLCVARFDGKPYPMTGPGDPPKQTMAFRKKGAASFEALTYVDGKLFGTDVYTVSADGKVLSDVSTPVATKKSAKAIFDRQ